MSGETDLNVLLATMTAVMADDVYVFATLPQPRANLTPRMMFQEAEGTTYILDRPQADAVGIAYEFPSRMITLNVHSALDAVGFIAKIATRLAAAGMGVNPVAGYYHDHLFVPEDRAKDALNIIARIATEAQNANPT